MSAKLRRYRLLKLFLLPPGLDAAAPLPVDWLLFADTVPDDVADAAEDDDADDADDDTDGADADDADDDNVDVDGVDVFARFEVALFVPCTVLLAAVISGFSLTSTLHAGLVSYDSVRIFEPKANTESTINKFNCFEWDTDDERRTTTTTMSERSECWA